MSYLDDDLANLCEDIFSVDNANSDASHLPFVNTLGDEFRKVRRERILDVTTAHFSDIKLPIKLVLRNEVKSLVPLLMA